MLPHVSPTSAAVGSGCRPLILWTSFLFCWHRNYLHVQFVSFSSAETHAIGESLPSFPFGFFTKLRDLSIMSCSNLESLSIPNKPHHVDLTSLKNIFIFHFPNLVSFPQGGLPTPNLERLWIMNCQKLKSLSPQMCTLLKSLEDLSAVICPEIVSFPEGGLPTTLSQLSNRRLQQTCAELDGVGLADTSFS